MRWPRILLRGALIGSVTSAGLCILLLVRLAERPLCGESRPVTPFITEAVCRMTLVMLGLRRTVRGRPMAHPGATVANHISWLDVFILNAGQRVYFVAKSEVAGWPFVGWLARATGTVFIARKGTEAKVQQAEFEARLKAGHPLLFFPEGTSGDGQRVLPFKSSLFAAFFARDLAPRLHIQPVTVIYTAPDGQDARFYGWWGNMVFVTSLLQVLAQSPQGWVDVIYHAPLRVADFADRKALTAACEAVIRGAHPLG
jgi:lyso-ornithine lipid O-acyltransferase